MKLIQISLSNIIRHAPYRYLNGINCTSSIGLTKTNKYQFMSENNTLSAQLNSSQQPSKVTENHRYGVALDIDGTITVQDKILPGAKQGLQKLISQKIPFICLTNNTSKSQEVKANELNKILNLSKPITAEQVVLNYTPVKHKLQKLNHGIVLIVGRKARLQKILPLHFIDQYITVDEYIALFPEAVPLSNRTDGILSEKQILQLKARLKINEANKHSLKISGVFLMTSPNYWQESYQIIIDHLSTQDGTVTTKQYFQHLDNHIPVIAAFGDKTHFCHEHNLPRILMNPFIEGLKAVYKSIYHSDLKVQIFGKPELFVYEFTKKHLQQSCGHIDKMIMIGDNEYTDIVGAYNAGWDSILVRSGVTYHESKIATVNAMSIFEGLQKYFQLQRNV